MKKIILLSASLALCLQAESFSKTMYQPVKNSEPVFETVTEYVPIESCEEVREPIKKEMSGSNILGTVAGAGIGGVLGNQIGGGRGKTIATVGGALLGAYAGNKVTSTPEDTSSYQIVKKCSIKQIANEKRVISGYKNTAYIDGKEIIVYSSENLKEVPVTLTYSY